MVRTMAARRGHGRGVALVALAAVLAATLVALVPGAMPASAAPIGTITSFGRLMQGPRSVVTGPDGNVWYTNSSGDSIGRVTPAGVVTTFTGTGISGPEQIAVGPDGNLWFTNYSNNSIGRITPAGVVSNFASEGAAMIGPTGITAGPWGYMWFTNTGNDTIGFISMSGQIGISPAWAVGAASSPYGIAAGPDGNLWYANSGDDSIVRVNFDVDPFTYSRFTSGTKIDGPISITAGPDGAMWFANSGPVMSIGRITTSGVVSNFTGPGIDSPHGITNGPDGNLWFTNANHNSIGRITPGGVVDTFTHGTVENPTGITTGPDGKLWFANITNGSLGRSTTAGVIDMVNGTNIRRPYGIAKGADGNLWFTNSNSGSINRLTPAGVMTPFTDPAIGRPYGITAGPDGNLWFTDYDGNQIGRITTAGVVTKFSHATIDHPHGITAGPDGALWFTNAFNGSIGRITTAGTVTNFTSPTISSPAQITTGPDGRLWFTNRIGSSIGAITTAGSVSNYTGNVAGDIAGPYGIASGPDGKLWFTNPNNNSIGRITTAGVVDAHVTDLAIALPYDLALGPDGNLWFTNFNGFSVGRVTPAGVVTAFSGTGWPIRQPYGMTAGPDGAMWFTNMGNNTIGRVVAANPPDAPTAVTGVRGNAQVAVSWTAPDSGGAPISGYTVTSSPGAKTCTTTGALSCTVTGLTNGTAYTFTVKATNVVGTGPASAASTAVTPATVPGAPTGASAVAGNAQASVSWAAPASNGGAAITGYTVTSSPGSKTCTTTGALSCTVTGLTNGTAYTFTVKATNGVGSGAASAASSPVTPASVTAPGAPTGVTAVAGKLRATVSWVAPASSGGSAITGYTATASPGGATCTTTGALTCAVTGLAAGTAYTFAVKATNAIGTGAASGASSAVVPWDGSGFHAVTPERILDSRLANKGFAGMVTSSASRSLQVTGLGGGSNVPASATAVVMNVTVADATDESFLTVFPTGTAKPNASNLNFGRSQVIPNLVTVKLGAGGRVEFANAVGGTHVIADVVGYYDDGTVAGDLFTGITPVRLLDSRTSNGGWVGPLPAGAPRDLVVRKPGTANGVPATATAVVANVTVTGGSAGSFVSVWPSGVAQPGVSNLNFSPGQTIPNLVTVKIGTNGAIRFANAVGSVDVIVDVVGYFDPTTGSRFHAINPTRFLDTRAPTGLAGKQGPGETRALGVAGNIGTNVPAGATGLVANVTVADGLAESFVSVFPGNVARPDPFSNLNFGKFQVIPNLTVVGIAPNGTINFYNHLGTVALIADATGYFAPT